MTNGDKLQEIKGLITDGLIATSTEARKSNLTSAEWLFLKGQRDALENMLKLVNDIISR